MTIRTRSLLIAAVLFLLATSVWGQSVPNGGEARESSVAVRLVTGQSVENVSWAEIDDELKRHRAVEEACGDEPDFLSFDCPRAQALALATEAKAVEKSSDHAHKRALSFSEYKHRHFLLALTKAGRGRGRLSARARTLGAALEGK